MTLYDDVCTPCDRKQQWKELRQFARQHNLPLIRVDIRKQPKYKEEAMQYEIEVPFVVHGGVALSLSEPLERLLS